MPFLFTDLSNLVIPLPLLKQPLLFTLVNWEPNKITLIPNQPADRNRSNNTATAIVNIIIQIITSRDVVLIKATLPRDNAVLVNSL